MNKAIKSIAVLQFAVMFLSVSCAKSVVSESTKSDTVIQKAKTYHDIRYGDKPDGIGEDTSSDRILDVYIPNKNVGEKLPVVIYIHGGGFAGGDKADKSNVALCSKIASYGYAVVSINYYLTLKYEKTSGASCTANMSRGIPANGFHPKLQETVSNASSDAQKAFRWIKNNADRYDFDISSVAISGGSAGAMTALYTAYVSNQKILPIKAVVNLWGGLENANLIKKGAAPLLTYHGDLDKLINVDFAYALKDRMAATGNNKSVLHVLKGKGHAQYTLIANEKTEEIAHFLKENLK